MERCANIVLHPLTQRIIGVVCLIPTISTFLLDIYNHFYPSFNVLDLADSLSFWKWYGRIAFFLACVLPFLLEKLAKLHQTRRQAEVRTNTSTERNNVYGEGSDGNHTDRQLLAHCHPIHGSQDTHQHDSGDARCAYLDRCLLFRSSTTEATSPVFRR